MSSEGFGKCPLCLEQMDLTDKQMKPCDCGYEICVWCWNKMIETADKDDREALCPACRSPYDKKKILGRTVSPTRLAALNPEKNSTFQKPKPKIEERSSHIKQRKDLDNMRVIRRNLVYVSGVPLKLADEKTLQRKEFFGQYGKVIRIIIIQDIDACKRFPNSRTIYVTFSKEEEACRCICVVNGYSLDGYLLRACFGTTRFCHAWLSDGNCRNPNCLYFHGDCPEEDILPKNEAPGACLSKLKQLSGNAAANGSWRRSGSILPPPITDNTTRTYVRQDNNDNWRKDGQTVSHSRTDFLVRQSVNHDHINSWRKDSQTSSDKNFSSLPVGQSRRADDTNVSSSTASVAVPIGHAPEVNSAMLPSRSPNDTTLLGSNSLKENRVHNPTMKYLVPGLHGVAKSSSTSDQHLGTGSIQNANVLTWKAEKHNSTISELSGENFNCSAQRAAVSPCSRTMITKPASSATFRVSNSNNGKGFKCLDGISRGVSSAGTQPDSFFSSDSFLFNLQDVSDFTLPRSTSTWVFPSSQDWRNKESCLTSTESSNSSDASDSLSFIRNKLSEIASAAETGYSTFCRGRAHDHEKYPASCSVFSSEYEQQKRYYEPSSCEETKLKHLENQSMKTLESDENTKQFIIDFDIAAFSGQDQHIGTAEQECEIQISDKDPLICSMISHIFSVDDDEGNSIMDCSLGKQLDETNTSKIPEEHKSWSLLNAEPEFPFARESYSRYSADHSNFLKSYSRIENMENIPVHISSLHSDSSSFGMKGHNNLTVSEVVKGVNEPVSCFNPCSAGISNSLAVGKWGARCHDPMLCHDMQNQITKFSQVKERSLSSFPEILDRLIPGSNYGSVRTSRENCEPKAS